MQFVKVMRKNTERKPALARIGKAASTVLTLTILAALIGCQGLSQSGGGQQNQQIGNLVLGNASLNFGSVAPNTSKSLALMVTNSGNKTVNISSASASTKYFALTPMTFPVSVPAGQSTNLSISFTPNAASTFSATLSISSDASNGAQSVGLSGTGVTPGALSANPTSLSFGSVTIGNQSSIQETITNTGASSVTVSKVGMTGAGLSVSGIATPLTLNAGQNAFFTVSFIPTASGPVNGNLIVTSTATNSTLTIPVSATGVTPGALAANPTSLGFGNVNVGSTAPLSEIIKNTGSSSVTVSKVAITGAGFSVSGITTPLTLNAGQNSPQFRVSFAPTTAGAVNGNLTITSTATNPTLTIPVSGTGVTPAGQLSVSPAPLALGNVTVGSSGTATGKLTASGASVTVTAASTNSSAFTISGFSLPQTIAAGQNANFTISFNPTAAGSATATLTFTSSAQPSTTTETLTGTGVAGSTHSVALSWSASTTSNISGYNVYRAPYTTSTSSCGGFVKINGVLDTSTLYTDSSVANGSVYCYATTAVDTSNVESGYSNIVSNVQIPTT